MYDPLVIGQRMREARQSENISQDKLSALSGCSLRTIGMIENGKTKMSVGVALLIANALHIKTAWLLDLED